MFNRLIFDTVTERVKKKKFLLVDSSHGTDFSGIDSKEFYEKNLVTQPKDWYYRQNKVRYTYNKHGYRTKEFKQIDWANSIVVFGCSNVFGLGVDDGDTLTSWIERTTGITAINMGAAGSSITFSLYNSLILNEAYPAPRAVIQIWTSPNRTIYFYKKSSRAYGHWNIQKNNYMDLWSEDPTHSEVHALFASMISKQIWSQKTKYYEGSFYRDTASLLSCDFIETIDRARDLGHPGRETFKKTAEQIAQVI